MILSKVLHSVLKSAEQYIQIMSFDMIIWFFIQIKKDWFIFENYAYIKMNKKKIRFFFQVYDVVWYQLNGRIRDLKKLSLLFQNRCACKVWVCTSCYRPGIHIFFVFLILTGSTEPHLIVEIGVDCISSYINT